MAKHSDPEGRELEETLKLAVLANQEVLDVGCGDGRLTFKMASLARRVVGLDPLEGEVRKAARSLSDSLQGEVHFLVGSGEALPIADESFDVVFFTWSLCCIASTDDMLKALAEAWRVLRPGGLLVNLQPSLQQPFDRGIVRYLITGEPRDLVQAEGKALPFEARFALKRAALLDHLFQLTGEAEFLVRHYYDTPEDALEAFLRWREEAYRVLDRDRKHAIRQWLEAMRTPQGILSREKAVVTVLRKVLPGDRSPAGPPLAADLGRGEQ